MMPINNNLMQIVDVVMKDINLFLIYGLNFQ